MDEFVELNTLLVRSHREATRVTARCREATDLVA